jgi:ketosteroid isomerase-like protein
MSADIELLRRATEAYNRGDLEALRDCYAPDITADAGELWPAAGRVRGVERVLSEFASMFATFERVEVVAEDYIERGGAIVVPSRWRGTVSGSDSVIEQPIVAVYRVRAGRVASIEYFSGLDAGLAAAEG